MRFGFISSHSNSMSTAYNLWSCIFLLALLCSTPASNSSADSWAHKLHVGSSTAAEAERENNFNLVWHVVLRLPCFLICCLIFVFVLAGCHLKTRHDNWKIPFPDATALVVAYSRQQINWVLSHCLTSTHATAANTSTSTDTATVTPNALYT